MNGLLGRIRGANPGPTLVLIAGIHGNEPAGVDGAGACSSGSPP